MQEPNLSETERSVLDSEPSPGNEMSEVGTLGSIFFEPGKTFADLKLKPRFIIAGVIIALLVTAYTFSLQYKIGEEGIRRFIAEQIDKSPRADSLSAEQKRDAVELQMTISKYSRFALPLIVFISFFIGALFYWAGSKAFGGTGGYMHALSVWVYSSFPPTVVGMVANFVVMAVKSAEEIDLAASQRSLLNANLGFLVDGKANPYIATLLATFDVFSIWGWILAAIGLRVTNRLSSGSAWAVVIIIALIGVGFRLIGAMFSGNPS